MPVGEKGGGGGGTDLQILGFQMGVEEVQKWQITVKTALWGELQGVKLLQKVPFFVVLREADLKRAMCKKHRKYREKLPWKHVFIQLLHFDVLSSFCIVPRRRNIAPR